MEQIETKQLGAITTYTKLVTNALKTLFLLKTLNNFAKVFVSGIENIKLFCKFSHTLDVVCC